MYVHCFFEQSGTFKNAFRKLGYTAYDYDLKNDFGQTDKIIDLFVEIENGYNGNKSLFDTICVDDLIFAFFPCIYFCEKNQTYFCGTDINQRKFTRREKIDSNIIRAKNREKFYIILLQLVAICESKKIKLIIENPYSVNGYLYNNFILKPAVIDRDRTRRGDKFKKPTQFFFLNIEPTVPWDIGNARRAIPINSLSGHKGGICSKEKSEITETYALNFIGDFILGKNLRKEKQLIIEYDD